MKREALLDCKVFRSRINSAEVGRKEKVLGYLLGPTGALLLTLEVPDCSLQSGAWVR